MPADAGVRPAAIEFDPLRGSGTALDSAVLNQTSHGMEPLAFPLALA